MKNKTQLLLLFLALFFIIPTAFSDLAASRSALLSLRATVGGRTLLWNPAEQNPCLWLGVQCLNDAVVGLHLPGFSLNGSISTGIFQNLTSLRILSLRYNELKGEIPSDISACSELRILNLEGNFFNGEIPDSLSSLKKLVRLNLADNNLDGQIPGSFSKLKRLRTLYLENNMLSGFLPELKLELVFFNVSNNQLNGSIPVSLSSMPVTAFVGNRLCGKPLQICPGIAASTGVLNGEFRRKRKGLSAGAIAGIVIASVVAFAIVLMIMVIVCGKKRSTKTDAIDISSISKQLGIEITEEKPAYTPVTPNGKVEEVDVGGEMNKLVFFGSGVGGKVFDLEELFRASAEVLGKGTFGTTYKAVFEFGPVVVVKRLRDATCSEREFKEKIEVVGAMDHENLLPIRAYYYSLDEKLLVCDYMPMGSLSAFLHGNKGAGRTPLNFEMRSRIALGVAHGISYLHSQGPNVSHGNIKSSNVLLTKSYEARVSDFCLAQVVGPSSSPNRANGYRAPEVIDPQRVSQKADVYGFGVLLLELLTGKAPAHTFLNEEGVDLPRWVQSFVNDERTADVFDLDLPKSDQTQERMVRLLELAMECSAQYPDSRPSMPQVTKRIEELFRCSSLKEESDQNPFAR